MEDKKVKVTILGHEISLQDSIGNVAKAVEWAQDYIKDAIKDVPYAPAVMAAVSLILPLLKNPAIVETANLEGFTYVTSQMRYYISMESLRLPEDMEPCLKFDLTSRIIDLYKLIIDFQLQTVIRFYRNGTKNYFRSTINYDQWGEKLSSIKQNECELDKKFGMAISGAGLQKLKNLALEAQNSRKSLDIIVTEIQELLSSSRESVDIMKTIHQSMSADEDRRRRGSLQATDPTLDKLRIEEEKGGLLRDSYRWILDHKDFQWWRDAGVGQLLWIKGDAGMGKTMLLCGIIDELIKLAGHTANISFFFCQASDDRVNNATAVLRGLIYMLVIQQPFLIEHVGDGPSFEGPNAWYALSRVFTNILEDRRLHSTYVIIDALDECTVDVSRLLNFVVQKSSTSSLVKWVVSSRSLPKIEKDLDDATRLYDAMPMKLDLESNREAISAAVRSFIQSKVDWLAKRNGFDQKLLHHVEQYLQSNANGIFLWVALVCQELANVDIWEVQEKLKQLPPGLDDLYKRMLTQVRESQNSGLCLSILGLVTSVYRPITLDELRSYVDLPEDISNNEGALARIIRVCGSFLTLRERVISLVHLSAKIFLLREIFPCGVADVHHSIFSRSLQIMAKTLRHDIYRLGSPGYPVGKVKHPHPDPLAVARYSCVYGIVHLQGCDLTKVIEGLRDGGPVDLFLRRDLLHWIEALSLLRSVSEGIDLMLGLESLNVSF
jgi:hypothetical protein